jgi:cell division protein FtsX
MGFFIMIDYLVNGLSITFVGAFLRLIFSGFIFSGFIIISGSIVSIIPISNANRKRLIILVEEKLSAEKV